MFSDFLGPIFLELQVDNHLDKVFRDISVDVLSCLSNEKHNRNMTSSKYYSDRILYRRIGKYTREMIISGLLIKKLFSIKINNKNHSIQNLNSMLKMLYLFSSYFRITKIMKAIFIFLFI